MTSKLKIKVADFTSGSTLLIEYNGILYATTDDYLRVRCDDTCTETNARCELHDACRELAEKLAEETKLDVLTYLLWSSIGIDVINHPANTFYAEKSTSYDSLLDLAFDGVLRLIREEASHD